MRAVKANQGNNLPALRESGSSGSGDLSANRPTSAKVAATKGSPTARSARAKREQPLCGEVVGESRRRESAFDNLAGIPAPKLVRVEFPKAFDVGFLFDNVSVVLVEHLCVPMPHKFSGLPRRLPFG